MCHLLSSLVVEWLKPSEGPTLRSWVRHIFISLRTLAASTLPSSTPHWSNELMPQMKPCKGQEAHLNTRCNAFASLYSPQHPAVSMPHKSKELLPYMKPGITSSKAGFPQAQRLQPCARSRHMALKMLCAVYKSCWCGPDT